MSVAVAGVLVGAGARGQVRIILVCIIIIIRVFLVANRSINENHYHLCYQKQDQKHGRNDNHSYLPGDVLDGNDNRLHY